MKSIVALQILGIAGVLLGAACGSVAADTLFQTGFEGPAYVAGQPLNGQNAWQELYSNGAGQITTNHPAGGQQSLQVDGGALSLVPAYSVYEADFITSGVGQFSQYPIVRFDTDVRLDGPLTGSTIADDLISANMQISTQNGFVGQMWISSNGHVQYASGADPGPTYDGYIGSAVTLGQYHDLTLLMDTAALTDNFYVDGSLVGTLALPVGAVADDGFYIDLSMIGYTDQPGYDHTLYTSYFDNVNLTAVPEPGVSVLLSSMVLVGAVSLRRSTRG